MKIGQLVELKSGSLTMTVEGFRKDARVRCVWSDARHKVHRNSFPQSALKIVVPEIWDAVSKRWVPQPEKD